MNANIRQDIPAIILTGGHSTRMGRDKYLIDYGKGPQWKVMYELLQQRFRDVYLSCRAEQRQYFQNEPCIIDQWDNIGPMGGIASALSGLPGVASVFVVGCDLPFFELELADRLVAKNSSDSIACCAKLHSNDFPDPLVAVWNRSALAHLKLAIDSGQYSIQKLLKQHPYNTVEVTNERWLFNANTPAEAARAMGG